MPSEHRPHDQNVGILSPRQTTVRGSPRPRRPSTNNGRLPHAAPVGPTDVESQLHDRLRHVMLPHRTVAHWLYRVVNHAIPQRNIAACRQLKQQYVLPAKISSGRFRSNGTSLGPLLPGLLERQGAVALAPRRPLFRELRQRQHRRKVARTKVTRNTDLARTAYSRNPIKGPPRNRYPSIQSRDIAPGRSPIATGPTRPD